jgi:hypothetical protein
LGEDPKKERTIKAGVTPATKHDKGRAEAAQSLENPGDSAVQLALTVQLMSYLPRERAEANISAD